MNKKYTSQVSIAFVSLGLFLSTSLAFASGFGNTRQFAVEMKMTARQGEMAGQSISMKYYAGESRLRMEISMPGMDQTGGMLIERDGDEVTSYMLMPQMQQYVKQVSTYDEYVDEGEGPVFGSPDDADHPCKSDPDTKCEKLGKDTVAGRPVVKYRVSEIEDGSPKESVIYFDPELLFPIRVESDDGTMEATSVEIGPQPAALFELPAGWTEMQMGY